MVKIALTVVAGIGGLVALVVAYRRQKVTEAADRHQREVAADTKHDLAERRITELYTKAVEQLGHEKAAVRLGGLHALERLAQNNPAHRQTVIDVFCAYLRMPIGAAPNTDVESTASGLASSGGSARQHHIRVSRALRTLSRSARDPEDQPVPGPLDSGEREVRTTAQRILHRHLRRPAGMSPDQADALTADPGGQFWPGHQPDHPRHSVDLTGAHLTDFDLSDGHLADAQFGGATFSGDASFDGATFSGDTWFGGATFSGNASFGGATFSRDSGFGGATFCGDTWFSEATFSGRAWFGEAKFSATAEFGGATFEHAWFGKATFSGDAGFGEATFSGDAWFAEATFSRDAGFGEATFSGDAWFGGATFSGDARFGGATFSEVAWFNGAKVADRRAEHVWPVGWIVVPDPETPTGGLLVKTSSAEAVADDDASLTTAPDQPSG